ncbi:acyl-CoA thioesterase domain-containing protein [Nocardia takedensis]|uniref:acyl-CoA thioesterase domain-containing protein n=1 Tax=Nocardia takedensis TaxID=259390 RepID=UPI0002E7A6AC|nr:acyl-CoA thioesterase domain-containing protein [Nocardia takedensis]
MVAIFTMSQDRYLATDLAVSPWSDSHLRGTAVCGLLAREAERHCPGASFVPARFTVDLFRPVLNEPIRLRGEVVRDGRRVRVVDTSIVQRDRVRARATVLYSAATEEPPGRVWQRARESPTPTHPLDAAGGHAMLFRSGERDWTTDIAAGLHGERLCAWHDVPTLVDGEPNSPFQSAAYAADASNIVCNSGTEGVGHINCDVTMTLSRLPVGHEIGLRAADRVATEGVAVASALMYDRAGPLGLCLVTGIANGLGQIDLSAFSAAQALSARRGDPQ